MENLAEAIERGLHEALARAAGDDCPPTLALALQHAVFPAGKRLRPRLVLAVAQACGGADAGLAMAGGVAIELLHCASLVHDDLPCFDDAAMRRGQPSVHAAFGQPAAILAGDALIILAFETLARGASRHPARGISMTTALARAVGAPHGITAGQAWESEPTPDLDIYHQAKTGALFAGASALGALSAGAEPAPWHHMGALLGHAFQTADDVLDAVGRECEAGKPVGRDLELGRPTAITAAGGIEAAAERARKLFQRASASVPECPGREDLRAVLERETARLIPSARERVAA